MLFLLVWFVGCFALLAFRLVFVGWSEPTVGSFRARGGYPDTRNQITLDAKKTLYPQKMLQEKA